MFSRPGVLFESNSFENFDDTYFVLQKIKFFTWDNLQKEEEDRRELMCSIVKEGQLKSAKRLKFGTGVYTHKGVYTFYLTMHTMFNLS